MNKAALQNSFPIIFIIGGIISVVSSFVVSYAATSATQKVTFNNNSVLTIQVSNDIKIDPGQIKPGKPVDIDKPIKISATSNQGWSITLSGTDFTSEKGIIPIDRLLIKTQEEGGSAFKSISNKGIAIVSNHTNCQDEAVIYYRFFLKDNDPELEGYKVILTYTLSN